MTATLLVAPQRLIAGAPPVVSENVPVPGGAAALARAIGIEPVPDRARFVVELARLIYADPEATRRHASSRASRLVAHLEVVRELGEVSTDLVPMPLPAAVWSQAVFLRPVAPTDLFAAVMSDTAAAMLAIGLAALDDETLRFFGEHPTVVTRLYEHDAPVFAAFAEHLRIHDNRVVPPGGDRAAPLWEALLGEQAAQPDRFVPALFAKDKGRLAYLYDTIGHLDSSRAAFALGWWIQDAGVRVDRFKALGTAAASAFREWHLKKHPFKRPTHDLVSLFLRVHANAAGAPGFPASRAVWARALDGPGANEEKIAPAATPSRGHANPRRGVSVSSRRGWGPGASEEKIAPAASTLIDAAWLVDTLMSGDPRSREPRLDHFAFGQRAFAAADPAALPEVLVALGAFPRFRLLMLTLERIGVSQPAVYAALVRQAQRLSELDAHRRHTALAQFQGAIALVARLTRVQAIDPPTAETLLTTLGAVAFQEDGRSVSPLADWLRLELRPVIGAKLRLEPPIDGPESPGIEASLLEALAGATRLIPPGLVPWEGQEYRLDLVMPEARRLRRILDRQGGCSIDDALDLYAIAQTLAAHSIVAQVADELFPFADAALGEALLSLSYAVDLGDAEGIARRAGQVARRHDFGFAGQGVGNVDGTRMRTAWALPKQVFKAGVPWHVEGAALGLDIAFAPLALRRINAEPLTSAPALSSPEAETFVTSLALMNPLTLQDAARDAIAGAVARGRRRVEALTGEDEDADALAGEIAMDGWRRRTLQWTIGHEPQRIGSLFSMTELLYLGGGGGIDLDPWGMSALTSLGCLCTRLAPPGRWTALVGRPQIGLLAETVAELNLRVAVILSELQLPAALAKSVLAFAVHDFVHRVRPSDADDWLTLVRTAQQISRERIEDYVAAATAGGPLVPHTGTKQ